MTLDSGSNNSINENENNEDDIEQQQQHEEEYGLPENVVAPSENDVETPAFTRPVPAAAVAVAAAAHQLVLIQRALERLQKSVVHGTRTVVQGTRSISLSTQIAATAAAAQVMNVVNEIGSHPLMEQQQGGDGAKNGEDAAANDGGTNDGVLVKGQENDKWITKIDERGVFVIGIAAFMAACWSFIAVVGQLTDISSLTVLLLSPTVMIQKKKLNALGSLRSLHNELRNMARRLACENVQMQQSVNSMESHLQRLNTVESQLTTLVKSGGGSGGSVERLVHVVEEHGQLQAELKRVLQQDVTHQLFSALLQSDVNGNYKLSHPDETSILEQRLQNVQGVVFNVDNFRKLVQSSDGTLDLTLTDAANIARQLQRDDDDEIPDAEKLFIFRPLETLKNSSSTLPATTGATTTTAATTATAAATATATAAATTKPGKTKPTKTNTAAAK